MRKFLFFRLQQNMTQATNLEGTEKNLILKCKIRTCNQEKKIIFIYLYAQQVCDCDFTKYSMFQPVIEYFEL